MNIYLLAVIWLAMTAVLLSFAVPMLTSASDALELIIGIAALIIAAPGLWTLGRHVITQLATPERVARIRSLLPMILLATALTAVA